MNLRCPYCERDVVAIGGTTSLRCPHCNRIIELVDGSRPVRDSQTRKADTCSDVQRIVRRKRR